MTFHSNHQSTDLKKKKNANYIKINAPFNYTWMQTFDGEKFHQVLNIVPYKSYKFI
jgi:hypothetical protein